MEVLTVLKLILAHGSISRSRNKRNKRQKRYLAQQYLSASSTKGGVLPIGPPSAHTAFRLHNDINSVGTTNNQQVGRRLATAHMPMISTRSIYLQHHHVGDMYGTREGETAIHNKQQFAGESASRGELLQREMMMDHYRKEGSRRDEWTGMRGHFAGEFAPSGEDSSLSVLETIARASPLIRKPLILGTISKPSEQSRPSNCGTENKSSRCRHRRKRSGNIMQRLSSWVGDHLIPLGRGRRSQSRHDEGSRCRETVPPLAPSSGTHYGQYAGAVASVKVKDTLSSKKFPIPSQPYAHSYSYRAAAGTRYQQQQQLQMVQAERLAQLRHEQRYRELCKSSGVTAAAMSEISSRNGHCAGGAQVKAAYARIHEAFPTSNEYEEEQSTYRSSHQPARPHLLNNQPQISFGQLIRLPPHNNREMLSAAKRPSNCSDSSAAYASIMRMADSDVEQYGSGGGEEELLLMMSASDYTPSLQAEGRANARRKSRDLLVKKPAVPTHAPTMSQSCYHTEEGRYACSTTLSSAVAAARGHRGSGHVANRDRFSLGHHHGYSAAERANGVNRRQNAQNEEFEAESALVDSGHSWTPRGVHPPTRRSSSAIRTNPWLSARSATTSTTAAMGRARSSVASNKTNNSISSMPGSSARAGLSLGRGAAVKPIIANNHDHNYSGRRMALPLEWRRRNSDEQPTQNKPATSSAAGMDQHLQKNKADKKRTAPYSNGGTSRSSKKEVQQLMSGDVEKRSLLGNALDESTFSQLSGLSGTVSSGYGSHDSTPDSSVHSPNEEEWRNGSLGVEHSSLLRQQNSHLAAHNGAPMGGLKLVYPPASGSKAAAKRCAMLMVTNGEKEEHVYHELESSPPSIQPMGLPSVRDGVGYKYGPTTQPHHATTNIYNEHWQGENDECLNRLSAMLDLDMGSFRSEDDDDVEQCSLSSSTLAGEDHEGDLVLDGSLTPVYAIPHAVPTTTAAAALRTLNPPPPPMGCDRQIPHGSTTNGVCYRPTAQVGTHSADSVGYAVPLPLLHSSTAQTRRALNSHVRGGQACFDAIPSAISQSEVGSAPSISSSTISLSHDSETDRRSEEEAKKWERDEEVDEEEEEEEEHNDTTSCSSWAPVVSATHSQKILRPVLLQQPNYPPSTSNHHSTTGGLRQVEQGKAVAFDPQNAIVAKCGGDAHLLRPSIVAAGHGGCAIRMSEVEFLAELDQQIAELQVQSDAVRHLVEQAKERHEMRARTRQLCMEHLKELRRMRWVMHRNFELCL